MSKFIYDNLKYPEKALKEKKEGVVLLKIDIDHTGKVVGSKISKSVGFGCDEEAQRLCSLLKFEIPKNPRKLRVLFHKNIKIQFKLPKKKTVTKKISNQKVNYTVVSSKTKDAAIPTAKQPSYGYTIRW